MADLYEEFAPSIFDEQWEPHRTEIVGAEGHSYGTEIGVAGAGQSFGIEVGAQQDAIVRTVTRARDNRRRAPSMRAVSVDADKSADQTLVGMCGGPGEELFPLTASLLKKYSDGTAGAPRIVRVDTEDSYKEFRTVSSPERSELVQRIADVEAKIAAHLADPHAHSQLPSQMEQDIHKVTQLSEHVDQTEAAKRIPLRMPHHFDGLLEAWHEDDAAGASMLLPREDGGRWVLTSAEPLEAGVLEAAKAAAEAGVKAADIVGYLPAIGATLAAGSVVKDLAAGAESILQRPEAKLGLPFVVRLEPKTSAPLYALASLATMCCAGNKAACEEWARLAAAAPLPLQQAMDHLLRLVKSQPQQTTVGGIGEFFTDLWNKLRHLFGGSPKQRPLPATPIVKALPAKSSA